MHQATGGNMDKHVPRYHLRTKSHSRTSLYFFFAIITLAQWHYISALPQNPHGTSRGSPLPTYQSPPDTFGGEQRESFEDRAAAWRQYQQEQQEHRTAAEAASPTDENGRMKLLATVSSASICFFFFVLMWRAVHHYECADAAFKGGVRLFMVLPPVLLFVGNMAGCVASFTSPSHSSKKRLKAILNLNKVVEVLLFLYNIARLTIVPSKYVPREIYIGRTLTNFIFLVQCQLFTKVAWNTAKQIPEILEDDNPVQSGQGYQYDYQQQPNNQYQQQQQSYSNYQSYGAEGNDGDDVW
mmetsp:Transcript_64998/g.76919  ORF Transcript_64998/g.76919 Transcript_64998/m.76919 type:complete len:297 (+) Transcript_64998:28-918(+)